MTPRMRALLRAAPLALLAVLPVRAVASSHMDAPLITFDDPANTTDVYAFVANRGAEKYLVTALNVYPFEEPGIGPNAYDFDPRVQYEINLSLGEDLARGRATFNYRFQFDTRYKNENTILQSYLGVVQNVDDANQNRTQTYDVVRRSANSRPVTETLIGSGVVPPNNQGKVTPFYNQANSGENPAKEGVSSETNLDRYTRQTIFELDDGLLAFAGQRVDGFYADIQGVFDLLDFSGPNKPFDSQGGFNVHSIVLAIPVSQLPGGDQQIVGVYATTSRKRVRVLREGPAGGEVESSFFVQVARQGNPLFNEGLVAIQDKDLYSRTSPTVDAMLFRQYALQPELAVLINAILMPTPAAPEDNRTDLVAIFIPDLIKVDLSTGPARLAGNPDDPGFHRLSIFGGDVLQSQVQDPFGNGGFIPGGWPNGRRFGDDVLDIAVCAVLSDLRTSPPQVRCTPASDIDRVTSNDITYNKVMPYAATPLNGRNHEHH
ncbi:MAG: DUF4331 domain-containing protein [Gemmatimonadota bacterium]